MKIPAYKYFSLADGKLLNISFSETYTLTAHLQLWDESILKLFFMNVVRFCVSEGEDINDLFVIDEGSFLQDAITHHYLKIPTNPPFKLYQLEDMSDYPLLQVVATDFAWNR